MFRIKLIYLQNNGIFYSYQQYQTMYTSFKFLEQNTTFGTIKDLWKNGTHRSHFGITEFIDSEIYSKNMDLLPDLSNIFVLVTNDGFPLNDISEKNCERIRYTDTSYILGYIQLKSDIILSDINNSFYFIRNMYSRISNYHITQYMVHSFERSLNFNCTLLPYEITLSTNEYWKECFRIEFGVETIDELYKMIIDAGILEQVNWDGLWSVTGQIKLKGVSEQYNQAQIKPVSIV